ncbi:C-C motif chemokine 8 isoform X5 [Astyanax mexicanus]|uniref:C-C motif chemokine 8-like n=1 Tax=Astyanax mexicanus TaxID=7994 RepID=A0A8T2LS52_ASTMX|nr:C-C motif chemokine 8 isoform X5 [Astyanax mexicanus]XP_049338655.1 C-C motif chemokine 8 isoform X5 [Astyanax mexicanus]KAG9274743.1 C-C motif chemokine 8-like [Astyanax mexicanus]
MRFWCGSLLLGLLIVLHLQSCVEACYAQAPLTCCFGFYKGKMPLDQIEKYEVLRGACPHPGVVFTRWAGNRVCADPKEDWVKAAMAQIDKRAD